MADLPSGTVTFLFTDVEGSTVLLRRLRARYGDVLADHQRLLRDAVAEAGGAEIDSQGDSFFFVFRRARDAVLAAANGQRALAAHPWPEDGAVRVRMGIHTGEAAVTDGRYLGVAVHRAARISSAGHGGQVLLSQTSHNLLEDEEELPLDLEDLGEQRLKDFERPVRVYQLVIPGLQERFPPLRTLEAQPETTAEPPPPAPSIWRRYTRKRRRWLVIAAASALAAGAVTTALALTLGGSGSSLVAPRSIGIIDPKRNTVVDQVHLGSSPSALAAGEGAVWAISTDGKTLTQLDPRSKETKVIALQGVPSDVAAGAGAVWVLHSSRLELTVPGSADQLVSRLDPRFLTLQKTIKTGATFDDETYVDPIVVGDGVWLGSSVGIAGGQPGGYGHIIRLDPANDRVVHDLPVRGSAALAADADATWATSGERVIRVDPASYDIRHIGGPGSAGPKIVTVARLITLGEGKVWVAGGVFKNCRQFAFPTCPELPGMLWRIDPGTEGVDAQSRVGRRPSAIAAGAGAVWVTDRETRSVWRIDPRSLRVIERRFRLAISRSRPRIRAPLGSGSRIASTAARSSLLRAVGKNLLLEFEDRCVLRSHLRMNGRWSVVPARSKSRPEVIRSRGQGDDNRTTYWCPSCQP